MTNRITQPRQEATRHRIWVLLQMTKKKLSLQTDRGKRLSERGTVRSQAIRHPEDFQLQAGRT